ncbi:PH domain-containing protein [Chloroflexus sp.]|uniref:PH domain-containing protein n=1 Tax=Chloroflexus sp. TaxID=1904827 RepID=UPI00263686C2|nr:PH domain-containing protein [uncultured Chloroflexus sp.]
MSLPSSPIRFAAAPLDEYAGKVTYGLAYVGGLLVLPQFFAYLANLRWSGLQVPLGLAAALALFLLLSYAFQPKAYRIDPDRLVIERRWAPAIRIPFEQISGVSTATALADMPRFGLRFAFNAGVFGYQGPFRLDPYGRVTLFATNRQRLVAIARYDAPVVIISPDRPRDFIAALNEQRLASATRQMHESMEVSNAL